MKAYVDYRVYARICDIYIVDDSYDGERFIIRFNGELWEREKLIEGQQQKPSISFEGRMCESIMQALMDAFTQKGIKAESESKIEGRLIATEKHLEDMRTLLKLRKP